MSSSVVYKIFQFLAGLEVGNLLGGHFHLFSGLRVAPHASAAFAGAEAAEASNLDLLAFLQGSDDVVENRLDNRFGFFARKFGDVQNFLDEISLCECRCRLLGHLCLVARSRNGPPKLFHRFTLLQRTETYGFKRGLRNAELLPFLSLK